jgi:hypothetical protein
MTPEQWLTNARINIRTKHGMCFGVSCRETLSKMGMLCPFSKECAEYYAHQDRFTGSLVAFCDLKFESLSNAEKLSELFSE